MIGYVPVRLGQAQTDILAQLVQLQNEIRPLIDGLSGQTVDPQKVTDIKNRLVQCQGMGPTAQAVQCMKDVKAQLQALNESVGAGTVFGIPLGWAIGGGAAALILGWLIFGSRK